MQIFPIPTVRMYMDTETHAQSADDDILVAVRHLLDEGVTGAPVVDDPAHRRFIVIEGQRLVGVITRKDILRAVQAGLKGC